MQVRSVSPPFPTAAASQHMKPTTQHYRMCRYSGDVLPVSEFTIDQFDCDRVCRQAPFGPKSAPKETSYTIRKKVENETKTMLEGFGHFLAHRCLVQLAMFPWPMSFLTPCWRFFIH